VASVKIAIVKIPSGKIVDNAIIGGSSKLVTFGVDRPEDLLRKPLADYVAKLFKH